MNKNNKKIVSSLLAAAVLLISLFAGCGDTTNYTEEIREYQERLEALQAENEALKAQLGITEETERTEPAAESEIETETSDNTLQPEAELETEETVPEVEEVDDNLYNVLVLGDSIWDSYRDESGIAAKVEGYMGQNGVDTKIYNCAIGGTRASQKEGESPSSFNSGHDASLAMMLSILKGESPVSLLEGHAAKGVMEQVNIQKMDCIILAYGMNDFLAQAPINAPERNNYSYAYGGALVIAVDTLRQLAPQAQIMIVAPTFASYFTINVQNYGEKALAQYASVACDVAKGYNTLCVDGYNTMGINTYNASDYLEDGVHLNAKGRDLYARSIASDLLYGKTGVVSGNALKID